MFCPTKDFQTRFGFFRLSYHCKSSGETFESINGELSWSWAWLSAFKWEFQCSKLSTNTYKFLNNPLHMLIQCTCFITLAFLRFFTWVVSTHFLSAASSNLFTLLARYDDVSLEWLDEELELLSHENMRLLFEVLFGINFDFQGLEFCFPIQLLSFSVFDCLEHSLFSDTDSFSS